MRSNLGLILKLGQLTAYVRIFLYMQNYNYTKKLCRKRVLTASFRPLLNFSKNPKTANSSKIFD